MAAETVHTNRRLYWTAALILVAVVAVVLYRRRQAALTAECPIHARVEIVTRDAPTSRALNITTDMLMLRNQDGDTWKDVDVSVSGYQRIGTGARQPSGTYVLPATKLRDKGGLYAIQMNDFENANGGARWVSLTMTPELFTVKATVDGRTCQVEVTPGAK